MPGRHNKATARDDYPTASRLGIIKPPWPQGRGRPWQLGRRRGFSARVQSSAESRGSLPRTWNKPSVQGWEPRRDGIPANPLPFSPASSGAFIWNAKHPHAFGV
jgi:hypothetical protein